MHFNQNGCLAVKKCLSAKLLFSMRASFVFATIVCMNLTSFATGQNSISLKVKKEKLRNVLELIEHQSEYRFLYNDNTVIDNKKVTIKVEKAPLEQVMEQLLDGTGITYKINGSSLVVLSLTNVDQLQFREITGTVTDEKGRPLANVSVTVKGGNKGTTTDSHGSFAINANTGDELEFSIVGYKSTKIKIGSSGTISIKMQVEASGLNDVVVVGYGTQKRQSVTGAISTFDAEEVKDLPVSDLSNGLAGRLSGVYVTQRSGMPGYAAEIQVRSVNTWKSSGNSPLYVIDGVISDKNSFDALDYSEVDNITVLKDVASGAIYGARAANGVIMVTTKTGKSGKFKLDYSYSYSFDRPSKLPDYMNSGDAIKYQNMARAASHASPFADDQEVKYYTEHDPSKAYFDKSYQDAVLQKHSLTGSGGTDKIKYFIGASYFGQTGFVKTTGYNKFNIRSNLDLKFTENLSGTFKMSYREDQNSRFSFQEDNLNTFDSQAEGGFFIGRLRYYLAFTNPLTSDGHLTNVGWIGNPLAFVEEGGTNTTDEKYADFQIGLNYKIPKVEGLKASVNFSRNIYNSFNKHYEIKPTVYDVVKQGSHGLIYTDEIIGSRKTSYPSKEYLGERQLNNKTYQLNFSLNYDRSFGKHHVGAVGVYEQSEGANKMFYGVRENFPLLQRDQFWATGSARTDSYVDGSEYESGRASYIGRLSYEYDKKYFMNATIRRDGSMLFGPNYRWGNFPSVQLGWILTNEDFMKVGFLNYLKLRTSYGLAGNDVVGGWAWAESFRMNGTYMMGTTSVPRVVYNGIVNKALTWEKSREFNIGMDAQIFDKISFSLDYYKRHNYDILDSRIVSLPISFGGNMPPVNYGIVDGHGIEIGIGYSGKVGAFNYEVKGNLTYSRNKVIDKDVPENVRDVDNPKGRSTDYVSCLVSKGILRTQKDVDALPSGYTIFGLKPALGALNFEDVSGLTPGVPDGKIDNYDRQVISGKHYLPPYVYGLNLKAEWKGIGVDILLQGATGVSIMYNDGYGRRFFDGVRPPSFWLDSWTPDNVNAKYPQAVTWDYTMDHQASTFWLKNGSYMRLQYLNLYYSLPKRIINKTKLTNVKFMLMAANLLTITSFDYYDPTQREMRGYPTMRTITLGINASF